MKIQATSAIGMVRATVLADMTRLTYEDARRLKVGQQIDVDDETAMELMEYQVAVAVEGNTTDESEG